MGDQKIKNKKYLSLVLRYPSKMANNFLRNIRLNFLKYIICFKMATWENPKVAIVYMLCGFFYTSAFKLNLKLWNNSLVFSLINDK